MVALWNRADHYIFALWFLSSSLFPRLISAVADWMSAILPHMVLPSDAGLKRAACGSLKIQTQKSRQKSPSGTMAQFCRAISSQGRHVSTIGKKLLNSNISFRCPHNMVNFGPLTAVMAGFPNPLPDTLHLLLVGFSVYPCVFGRAYACLPGCVYLCLAVRTLTRLAARTCV